MNLFRSLLLTLVCALPLSAAAQATDAGALPAANEINGTTNPGGIVEFWVDDVKIATQRADKDGKFSFIVPSDIVASGKNVQVRYNGISGGSPSGSFSGGAVGCNSAPQALGSSWVLAAVAALSASAFRRRDTRA